MSYQPRAPKLLAALAAMWSLHGAVCAQLVVNDTLTGASSSYDWKALGGACLTAGDNTGNIPACVGLPYYGRAKHIGGTKGRLPDAVGQGALRLSNGDTCPLGPGCENAIYQSGALVSNFTFPTKLGMQVTFRSVTYGGNNLGGTGADGMSFFLVNGKSPPSLGARGGGLGYTCNNLAYTLYDGITDGYLGIGIDEYGNFGNRDDNGHTGTEFHPNRIVLRGAGNTNWAALNANHKRYYPDKLKVDDQALALKATCQSGMLVNYSGAPVVDANGRTVAHRQVTSESAGYNYPMLAYSDVPEGISNQQAIDMPVRGKALPIDYAIKLTQSGLLSLSYSVNGGAVRTLWSAKDITQSNGPLPEALRFGFAAGTGGGVNVHEILCFKAGPTIEANTSAGGNVQQTAFKLGTQLYLSSYQPLNWWSQLTAQDVLETASGGLTVNPVANWDASCTLSGGACPAISPAGSNSPANVTAQTPTARTILSWGTRDGIALDWAALSAAQKSALTAGDAQPDVTGPKRLQYLRGDRSSEIAGLQALRTRTGVLGDIIDSSPTWVGPPSLTFAAWRDKLHASSTAPELSGPSYEDFKTQHATRQHLIYVGANDGLLHAFKAGANDASGNFVGTSGASPNNGYEALAYMPSLVLDTIHSATPSLDFSSPQYGHNFFVDATPATGDLFYNGAWHTWLVSGLGAGGNAAGPVADKTSTAKGGLFALDITDPAKFSEANAANIVVGDWSSATLGCSNVKNCGEHLGSVVGTPLIRRLHNGQWAVLSGNGLNSASGMAGLFIMLVDPNSGATSWRFLSTGAGPIAGVKNGIASVVAADLDADQITDFVYAGDAMGNLWRFDLTNADPASWAAATPALFKALSGQPITAKPVVAIVPGTGSENRPRVMVGFGTGQRFVQTQAQDVSYSAAAQSLYGIWDTHLLDWNSKGSTQYAALSAAATALPSDLQVQSVTSTSAGNSLTISERVVSNKTVCWRGSNTCPNAADNKHLGWSLPLPATGEQAFYNPVLDGSRLVVNTLIPPEKQPIQTCELKKSPTGYTMGISMAQGGAGTQSMFATTTGVKVSGIGLGATGTPMFIRSSKGKKYAINQTIRLDASSSQHIANNDGFTDCSASGRCSTGNRVLDEVGVGKRINWLKRR
jgi:type IV pilus assembly protein PilY1